MVRAQIILKKYFSLAPQTFQTVFASLLGLTLIWSWLFWLPLSLASQWVENRSTAICHPFFQSCQQLDPLTYFDFSRWNDLMGLCGFLTVLLALKGRVGLAKMAVGVGFLIKLMLFVLDFRLMGNYHLIGFYFVLLLILTPSVSSLQFLFCLVYFFASLLKLNPEWVSGDALYGEIPGLSGLSLVYATSFVVLLELFGSWMLLSRDTVLRWSVWSLFVLFHVVSAFVVGFFYPAVMLTLLLFFPFCWSRGLQFEWRELRRSTAAFAVVVAIQLVPMTVTYPSLTGEGRSLALNMFDAKAKCSVAMMETQSDQTTREIENPFLNVGYRIGCDPYLFMSHLKNLCKKSQNSFGLFMKIRGNRDFFYPVEIAEPNMCKEEIRYSWWQRNPWIKTTDDGAGQRSSVSLLSLFR